MSSVTAIIPCFQPGTQALSLLLPCLDDKGEEREPGFEVAMFFHGHVKGQFHGFAHVQALRPAVANLTVSY